MILRLKYDYYSKGYVIIRNVLNKKDLDKCKDQLILSYKKILRENINYNNIHELLTKYEKNKEWDKLYIAFKDACQSKPFLRMSKKLENLTKNFFNVKTKTLTCAYAIGIKNSKRTSYDWHQEKTYYSKIRKKTFHYQFPFFEKCIKLNGTMSVLEGSHTLGEISNYTYNRKFKKGVYSYIPKDIKLMQKYFKEKFLNMNIGDVCIFHENLIHRSNINKTNKVRFAGINRQQAI
ncbi:phytanoyl-CoA dioxygenase family protein [Candidatus Pelagibacter sp. HIMB1695]|uniref:phytanoyl-CoA dioxygenase family protein n=1 Tax=Candidatus Pelagibacter sp. HIMB1695 TaxID=3413364 RepID=UPI003F86D039